MVVKGISGQNWYPIAWSDPLRALASPNNASPSSLHLHWLGHLPSLASPALFTRSHGLIEYYTNISKPEQGSILRQQGIERGKEPGIVRGIVQGKERGSILVNEAEFIKFIHKTSCPT